MSSVFSLIHKQPTINYLAWLCINPHHHLTPTPLPPGHNHTGARLSSRHAHKILKTCGIVRVSEWQWLMGNKLERKIKFTFNCLVSLNQTSWHFFEALFKTWHDICHHMNRPNVCSTVGFSLLTPFLCCLLQSLLRWPWSYSSRRSFLEIMFASFARPGVNPPRLWCGSTTPGLFLRHLATASRPGCCASPTWVLRTRDCTSAWLRTAWAAHRRLLVSSWCQQVSSLSSFIRNAIVSWDYKPLQLLDPVF